MVEKSNQVAASYTFKLSDTDTINSLDTGESFSVLEVSGSGDGYSAGSNVYRLVFMEGSQPQFPDDIDMLFQLGATDTDGDVDQGPLAITIKGEGPGADLLEGDQNEFFLDDILVGNGSDEVFVGGLGSDTLTGGGGADTFVYNAVSDSPVNAGDIITDLSGDDSIDIEAMLADAGIGSSYAAIVDPGDSNNAILQVKDGGDNVVAEITVEGFGSNLSGVLDQVDDGT